jgi:hypothetical protein
MTEVQLKTIYGKKYIAAPEGQKIWIVYQQWPTGKIDRVAAYFMEDLARTHAASLVGRDRCLIGLETIDVLDAAPSPS